MVAGLTLEPLRSNDFPEELRSDFEWVKAQLTRRDPVKGAGRLEATMASIHNSTGEKIAKRIFKIFAKLEGLHDGPSSST
jgi:hypothetical protein